MSSLFIKTLMNLTMLLQKLTICIIPHPCHREKIFDFRGDPAFDIFILIIKGWITSLPSHLAPRNDKKPAFQPSDCCES